MAEKVTLEDLSNPQTMTIWGTEFTMYGTVENPLFLAADVAEMIEYSADKVGQMLENVDDDEKLTDTINRAGESRKMWFLTENGLYELLMQSRKPLARGFKREVKKMLHALRRGELISQRVDLSGNNIIIEGTRFIFATNFSGDPKRDHFGSNQRKANLVIPTEDQAKELQDMGFNVRQTKPRPDEEDFTPTYFVSVRLNYDSRRPPRVHLVTGPDTSVLLDEESVKNVDDMWVDHVNAVLNPYDGPNGKSLYVTSMEVFQKLDDDPIAAKYRLH